MILEDIVRNKEREVAERLTAVPLVEMERRAQQADSPRIVHFAGQVSVIAEVKRRSPSKGEFVTRVDPAQQARSYEAAGASAISVLTDQKYFGGTFDDLDAVRNAVSVPVLCKDFLLSPYQIYEARSHGADLILLIVKAIDDEALITLQQLAQDLGMAVLVEVHDQHDLARALAANAVLIGINNRDLDDFHVDLLTTGYLGPLVPDDVTVVSESGIATREDVDRVVEAGASVVLVGEALMRSDDPGAVIKELLG